MKFIHKILRGKLVKRYKRFLADVDLGDGIVVTAHCPNTGGMSTCSQAGRPVLLSDHGPDCGRKLRYTFEAIQMGRAWVGVNTMNPNRVVLEAVQEGTIPELAGYVLARREVKYGQNSRIDLLLSGDPSRPGRDCYVEVKNTTMKHGEAARFPDAITERGLKHIEELERIVAAGHRAVLFFFVGRSDCTWMGLADAIDADYSAALRRAVARSGVEALAYQARFSADGIRIARRLEVRLEESMLPAPVSR